jgi:hypothetical protein
MRHRGQATKSARGVYQNVQSAKPLVQAWSYRIDLGTFRQIERQQRRAATECPDRIVGFFQASLRSCGEHDVCAALCQLNRNRRTDAAAGSGDQGDAVGQR